MQWRNTAEEYGFTAKILHWVLALLVIGMLGVGLWMVGLPVSPDKFAVYGWHKSIGVMILALVALRMAWRLTGVGVDLPPMHVLLRFGARAAHWGLYALMIAMPLTGWMMSSAAGFPVSVFGWFVLPDLVGPSPELRKTMSLAHEWLAYLLIALIAAHAAAAMWHHFVRKDNVLRGMWFAGKKP